MTVHDIPTRIASFPDWHYDFDLHGHHTNPKKSGWQEARRAHLIAPLAEHYGGTLAGKRVLDLGCNAGFFSLAVIEAGCDFVLGIDGRQTHIDQANLVFETKDVAQERYQFTCANFLDFDYASMPPFDIVLCLGVLYHVNKPIDLFEKLSMANTDLLVIDTKVASGHGPWLELRRDSLEGHLDAVDYELVMVPTAQAVMMLTRQFGYETHVLAAPEADRLGMGKWRYGIFASFICAKQSDLAASGAFKFRSLSSLYRDQRRGEELRSPKPAVEPKQRSRWSPLSFLARRSPMS